MARNKPALQQFIEEYVGGQFTVAVTQVTVTTSATKLLANNFERMAALIINTGAANISMNPGPTVTTTMGVQLGAGGGFASLDAQEDLALVGFDWWAVVSALTSTVTVIEIIRYNADTQPTPAA